LVQLTRQDCAIASAGLMRSGLAHALHHARYRSVFQKHLADQPLMQAVLADMALHVEASIALVMRLCRFVDRAPDDVSEAALMRLADTGRPNTGFARARRISVRGDVSASAQPAMWRRAFWRGTTGNLRSMRSGGLGQCDVPGCASGLSREADAAQAVLQHLAEEAKGLRAAADAVAFIGQGIPQAGL